MRVVELGGGGGGGVLNGMARFLILVQSSVLAHYPESANAGLFPISLVKHFLCKTAQKRNQNKTPALAVIKRHSQQQEAKSVCRRTSVTQRDFFTRCQKNSALIGQFCIAY